MHLMFSLDANGKRIYTLKKVQAGKRRKTCQRCVEFNRDIGEVTRSAHPARFSPDDKYSRSMGIPD